MGAARIYWDRSNYAQVERIFRQSAEFASEHEVWKLNVAHTFFMQESKYREAIRYYAPVVKEAMDNSAANAAAAGGGNGIMMGGGGGILVKGGLLDIPAIVLANLCVSYIMTSQNEEAEEIMRRVEADEAAALADAAAAQQALAEGGGMVVGGAAGMLPPGARNGLGSKPVFHLCIINLVIGTLYCSKGNYEFGISRVLKSLEPLDRKLGPDTWYYAKRCFVALAEVLAKHMITIKDSTFEEILSFLADCDRTGKGIVTVIAQGSANATMTPASANATMAAQAGQAGPGSRADGGGDESGAADPSAADNAASNAFTSAAAAAAALLPGLLGSGGGSRTVSYEARLLRRMYMVLRDEH